MSFANLIIDHPDQYTPFQTVLIGWMKWTIHKYFEKRKFQIIILPIDDYV